MVQYEYRCSNQACGHTWYVDESARNVKRLTILGGLGALLAGDILTGGLLAGEPYDTCPMCGSKGIFETGRVVGRPYASFNVEEAVDRPSVEEDKKEVVAEKKEAVASQVVSIPVTVEHTVDVKEANKAKDELSILNVEKEIVSYAVVRLYEAEAEGKISKNERIQLVNKYKDEMKNLDTQIDRKQTLVKLHELEEAEASLVKMFHDKFGEINKFIEKSKDDIQHLDDDLEKKQMLDRTHDLEEAEAELTKMFTDRFGEINENIRDIRASLGIRLEEGQQLSSTKNIHEINDNPLQILKVRLAKGEITKEQYEEIKKLLEEDS